MNGSWIIDGLQMLSAASWFSVFLSRLPSALRIIRGRNETLLDLFALIFVGNAAVQMGFVLRWWLYPAAKRAMEPGELTLWGCLYLVSAMLALATHLLPRRG